MDQDARLSRLDTLWSVVQKAHGDQTLVARDARAQLLERYGRAIRRYLIAALRNENDADEVFQEFSLKMARGDFQNADPARGRFRHYVKTALFRLVTDFRRGQAKAGRQLHTHDVIADEAAQAVSDQEFSEGWRKELIDRSLELLQTSDQQKGTHFAQILQLRIMNAKQSSAELAQLAGRKLGRPLSAESFRGMLMRARLQFGQILLEQVSQSLVNPCRDELESELAELRLLEYCRAALDRGQQA